MPAGTREAVTAALSEAREAATAAYTELKNLRTLADSGELDVDGDGFEKIEAALGAYTEAKERAGLIEQRLSTLVDTDAALTGLPSGNGASGNGAGGAEPSAPARRRSMGQEFVESERYRDFRTRGTQGGNWSTGPIELRATLTEAAASGGKLIMEDWQEGILPILFRDIVVGDLFAQGATDSNVVRYLKETTATNAAAATAEGAAKPESTLIFDQVDEPVRKVTTFLPVSDEMLEDEAQIRSYIDARLRLFILLTEEDQLLNGSGVAPNITGLLNRSGIQTQAVGVDTKPDAIYKAITKVRVAFLEPDGMVIHPNDWQDLRLLKDANNQYYGGGPFTGAYGAGGIPEDRFWGLRVVITTAIAEGTAVLGAFRTGGQVFRRGGLTVEASNSHSDFFQKNLTAIRAEERLALAVYRATAFCTITGL